jgi:SOS-response transcriptional repressor LexA
VNERLGAGVVRVRDGCMAPRVPAGAWVSVDPGRTPQAGDVVLAVIDDELAVRGLIEWAGRRWLTADHGPAPVPVGPEAEIRGVVTRVLLAS